ncbi:FAD binding domain protein [Diaporthe sp. PMI_573]|nr:FAD binding domain protein [Diaporthaceae sp. PMI_573]
MATNGSASAANGGPSVPAGLPIAFRDSTPRDQFLESAWGHVFNHRRATEARVPRAVVHATSAAHVRQAVQIARDLGCRVSVRSGGHSWAGWSVRDDAVCVDLGALPGGKHSSSAAGAGAEKDQGQGQGQGLEYDPRTRILSCPPSATGRVANAFLATKGRMFAGGHCPDVGLGGFLLQGGMGWNCKNWGWACESIVGIDVVTADAREIYCSKSENADLFWAARGSGPGFPAIVTRFHLLTRPLPEMYQSIYIWPISEYRKVLKWVIDICEKGDNDTEMVAVGQYIDSHPDPVILANFLTFKPNKAEGEAALRPMHDDPGRPPNPLIEEFAKTTTLPDQYAPQALANPEGHRYCSENAYISNDADVPAVLERAFTTLPHRKAFALYYSMYPTSRRPHYLNLGAGGGDPSSNDDAGSMALSMHTDHYFALYTVWEDEKDDEKCVGWTHSVAREVERSADGSYLGDSDFQHRRTKFWRDENAKRLMEIRRKWDPEGRICGYLDEGDKSGVDGLKNEFEWK